MKNIAQRWDRLKNTDQRWDYSHQYFLINIMNLGLVQPFDVYRLICQFYFSQNDILIKVSMELRISH